MEDGLRETCRRLKEQGKQVVLLRDNPFYPRHTNHVDRYMRCDLLGMDYALPQLSLDEYADASETEEPFMQSLTRRGLATVLDITPALEENGKFPLLIDGKFLYRDTNHLSRYGSERVARLLLEWMQQNVSR